MLTGKSACRAAFPCRCSLEPAARDCRPTKIRYSIRFGVIDVYFTQSNRIPLDKKNPLESGIFFWKD
jgi:hypothetical protein